MIVKALPLQSGVAHDGVEMYTAGRFFTMTGGVYQNNAKIVAAPKAFAALTVELQNQAGRSATRELNTPPAKYDLSKFNRADGERLRKLLGMPADSLSDGLEANIEEIRSAISAIPLSAISTEPDWVKLARGLAHEAAVYKKQAEPLWEVLDGASRNAPGYNEADNRDRWSRYIREAFDRANPITIATVFDLAKRHGWLGWSPAITATSNTVATPVNSHRAFR